MTQSYDNQNTHSGDSIFEDVYIYGKLYYDFQGDASFRDLEVDTLKVLGNSWFGGIATLEDLDQDALVTILTEPKNALVKQYQRLFELEETKLNFTDDALNAIAKRAIERKTGARGLRSILEEILLDTMFDLPGLDEVTEFVGSIGK